MRDFKGMEHLFDEDYCRRIDHRFHAQGTPLDPEWIEMTRRMGEQFRALPSKQPWWTMTDRVWIVCLHKAGVLEKDQAAKVLKALDRVEMDSSGSSGEERIAPLLEEGMDLASTVNYGRTLQEPMSRLEGALPMHAGDGIVQRVRSNHGFCRERPVRSQRNQP